jgi:hypothetical protein
MAENIMGKEETPQRDTVEWYRKCREIAATKCTDNIYEQIRVRIVRVMREHGYIDFAAEDLGVSVSTIRRYMRFVPFEHLMRDPSLENRFDWRSMTNRKWVKLLRKHPIMIRHLKKNHTLGGLEVLDILLDRPELASHFDLSEWNRLGLEFFWSDLLVRHPEFAEQCDWSKITARAAANILLRHPQFFDRIRIDTLWPYHWTGIIDRQPQIEKIMEAKPHSEWPFNYWVHAVQFHPELEPEFHGWDRIAWDDVPDFKRRQPEMYYRHHLDQIPENDQSINQPKDLQNEL